MRTIGFYSFKGGVGRSNLLMNIAFFLAARRHKHVGILDLDLEAPGLTIAPSLQLNTAVHAAGEHEASRNGYPNKGLMDFIEAGTQALRDTGKSADKIQVPNITDIFYETKLAADYSGSVHLAPAEPYPKIQKISSKETSRGKVYHDLTEKWNGQRIIGQDLFRFMVERIRNARFQVNKECGASRHELDYLLSDLRTGMTELADTSAGVLFSELFMVSGLNTQNIEGLFIALHSLKQKLPPGDGPEVRVFPIFSPIPNAELMAVREKIRKITARLHVFKEELQKQGSRLRIILPNPSVSDIADTILKSPVIHYCDYLALHDDSVLIEQFPETQTARDLIRIAEDLEYNLEDIKKQTAEALNETADLRTESSGDETQDLVKSRTRETSYWHWLSDVLVNPPSWRWPLDDFADKKFHVEKFIQGITKDDKSELRDQLLDRCAISSLEASEKVKVIRSLPKLSEKQMRRQLGVFTEEQTRLLKVNDEHAAASLLFNSMREWLDALKLLGAPLISIPKMVARVRSGGTSASSLPPSGLLLLFIHEETEVNVARDITDVILDRDKSQLKLQLFFLKSLSKCARVVWGAIKEQVLNWAEQALTWNAPSSWLRDCAVGLHRLELHESAEKFLLKAVENSEQPARLWYMLGYLQKNNLKDYDQAEAAYRKSIELDPQDASPWNGLGNLLSDHFSRYAEAEEAYRKSIEIDPQHALPWNNLGLLLKNHLSRYAEAEEAYRKSIELNPQYALPWNNLGLLLKNHFSRYAEAEEAYRKSIEIDPQHALPWNNLGNLLSDHLSRYAEAEEAYRKSIELDPQYAYPYYNLYRMLLVIRRVQEDTKRLRDKIRRFVAEYMEVEKYATFDLVYGPVFAIVGKNKELSGFITSQRDKQLDIAEKAWLHILAAIVGRADEFPLELPEKQTAADDIESTIQLTATLSNIIAKPALKKIKEQLQQTLARFVPPPGSRGIEWQSIDPYLQYLGWEDMNDRTAG